ncbi:MAG: ABC transporter ATP-binding protein [Sulfuricaulis sp.]|uniref:ABC transporter ATP-binding protein n=1 Tax=Sulfuricaulis sp. TaxID=2003553 RepID=UPI0025D6E7C9|nr:ABC transporter ATP-binding protein [Sulfuricaulis sp.]MCR4346895.1 ABC transporter ATP-binding protein [Sulfuricaulis sp.]
MPVAIAANNLVKRFGAVLAVNSVSLSIPPGEIFGLLGPNAAGKSTLIRLLSGILSADGGNAEILGYDLATHAEAIKKRIGYVAQHFALYPELTVAENLDFYSAIYQPITDAEQARLLEQYGLAPYRHRRAGQLSGGYKRRLSIACAMAHDPKLIFLDEPTAGIDPVTRKELWESFYALAASGKTLFVTTHYMEEAERCHRLAFINKGGLVGEGTPTQIRGLLKDYRVYACRLHYDPAVVAALSGMDGVLVLNQFGEELRIITDAAMA